MLPELLMLIVWQSGFVSTQPNDINKFTNAVVVSKTGKISSDVTPRKLRRASSPDVTWCCLLLDCFTRANSFDAFAYVRQVLPSWSVCLRFALYCKMFRYYFRRHHDLNWKTYPNQQLSNTKVPDCTWKVKRRSEVTRRNCAIDMLVVCVSQQKNYRFHVAPEKIYNNYICSQVSEFFAAADSTTQKLSTLLLTRSGGNLTHFTTDSISCCPIDMLRLSAGKNSLASYFLRIQFSFSSLDDVGTKISHRQ